jgi:hypothetical protein
VFEDSFFGEKTAGPKRSQKALLLALVLVLHGVLVYGILHARFTIKMLNLGKETRTVRIVPPFALTMPKIVGSPGGASRQGTGGGRPPSEAGGGEENTGGQPEAARPGSPAAAEPPHQAAPGAAVAALSENFQKPLAIHPKNGEETGLKISLAPPGTKPAPETGSGKSAPSDMLRYMPGPPGSGTGALGAGTGSAGRGGTSRQRASLSIPLKGYNIAPWASKIVALIQRNWVLPNVGKLSSPTRLRLILMVKKNGELSSLEVDERSSLDILDQAALRALRASLPFPALPDDFPGDILEAYLEFSYDD